MFFNLNNNIDYINSYNDNYNIFKYSSYQLTKYDKLYKEYLDLEKRKNKEIYELSMKYNKLKKLYKSNNSDELSKESYPDNIIKNTEYEEYEKNSKKELIELDKDDIEYIKL